MARWSSGLRLRPLTPATAVRIRYGSPLRRRHFVGAEQLVGVDDGEGTPVPIPNTAVKLISAENTLVVTPREDRAMPTQTQKATVNSVAFFIYNIKMR